VSIMRVDARGRIVRAERRRWGSTRAWRKVRAAVLERDGWRCYWCGGRATEVDHLRARARGGGDEPGNLVASCMPCNRSRGAG
jgi:5-methylcytosine-specific restriction enzyme A